jgi:hypothetical protein
MRDFANVVIRSFNGVILAANAVVGAILSVINSTIRAAKVLGPVFGGALFFAKELDPEQFRVPTIEEMQLTDFISDIEDVDVSGIGGNLEARFGQGTLSDRDTSREGQGLGGLRMRDASEGFRSLGVPQLANGGIVDSATLAIIGEAGPEAVVPLDRMGGDTYNITVNSGVGDPVRIGEDVVNAIKRYERVSGPVFASA